MDRISTRDGVIDEDDVMIAALSILDRRCNGLLTYDDKIIESRAIIDIVGNRRFTVTSNPFQQ